MERRRVYAEKHQIQKIDFATDKKPFTGMVICGVCGRAYGRKVWNSPDERLRRIIWRCNNKYVAKEEKGCGSRHVDDKVLYRAFIVAFNPVGEHRDYFMAKWVVQSEDVLKKVIVKRFIDTFGNAKPIKEFDVGLYFKLMEKITVYEETLVVGLLDGSEVECEI